MNLAAEPSVAAPLSTPPPGYCSVSRGPTHAALLACAPTALLSRAVFPRRHRWIGVTEPPLVIPAKPCAIQPAPCSSRRLAAEVIGYAKVAFAVPDSRAGDVLGSVARFTPSVRTHFCK